MKQKLPHLKSLLVVTLVILLTPFYALAHSHTIDLEGDNKPSEMKTYFVGETCANAFPMTVESSCDGTNAVTFDFANGGDIDANNENPSCDGFGNFGYFLSFTAPTVGSVVINFSGAADNIGLEVYDACGGTPVSDCTNNAFDAGDNSGLIGNLTPGNTYVAVIWRDSAFGSADVCIEQGPTCAPPTDLAASNVTTDTANLSWIENGTATLWNVEIVSAGATPTGISTATGVSNPYNVTGLLANTAYDFYVQADCGGGDVTDFSGPFTFTTACNVLTPNYIEQFGTIIPNCWDEADSGNATTGPTAIGNSSWQADGFLNNGSTGAYRINLWVADKSDWLLSPYFDLTGGPFQVEFDFGIMEFGSSTNAGTLGSDDTVQLLITNDNGATWTPLLTYDTTSVVAPTGEHPIITLEAYAGQIVRFGILASEGLVDDVADNEIFVDNFNVRTVSTCAAPSDLTANSLSSTATEIGWTENGTATVWNIEYGLAGFALGTGTLVTGISTNSYTVTGLTADTDYEFYVQAECDPMNLSLFSGPLTFFNGYCDSVPTSNDGEGVTNVTIGTTDFPSLGDVTYEDQTSPVVNVFQGSDTSVAITFATSFTYGTNIWIDFDDNLVFDDTELVFQGESDNANPTTLDASFVMPITGEIGQRRMRIGTADAGQAVPNPCYNGSWGVTLDFTVNIQDLNCTFPEANYSTSNDCDNDQFFIDVDITSLGDATSLEVSNDFDANTIQATEIGVYQLGPFPFGDNVKAFVTNEQDTNCEISSQSITVITCPPENDEPCNATILDTGDALCNYLGSGTIFGATDSGITNDFCNGNPNDDVWFQFTATAESHTISIQNIIDGTPNLDHSVYEGTCDNLFELYCDQTDVSIAAQLTIGSTYFVRVFSATEDAESSAFEICIRDTPANFACDGAVPFCSFNGDFTTPNATGVPSLGEIACLFSTPNPTWNTLQIGSSGTIEIQIEQNDLIGVGLDVDFVIWGPFNSVDEACDNILLEQCDECPNNTTNPSFYPFGNIVDCSYSAQSIENLTIENAQYGEVYLLLVTNFSGQEGIITIDQTNLGDDGAGSLTAELEVDLGPDINVCESEQDTVIINASSPFADSYEWYFNGALLISGEDVGQIEVSESGIYTLIAYNTNCDVLSQDEIAVSFLDCSAVGLINVTAFNDTNANMMIDSGEFNFTNGYFTYERNNDGVINVVESSTGTFTIASDDELNTYDFNYYFYDEYEDCFDVSVVSFNDIGVMFGESIAVEFPIVDEGTCEDIGVYLVNQQAPRPGFDHLNYLIIENLGLTTVTGTVEYQLDDDLIINAVSSGSNYLITTTTEGFNVDFTNLAPGQNLTVSISLMTPATLELGELVTNTAIYSTAGNDMVADNNLASITEEVIGAFDPNDKMEVHGPEIVYNDFITTSEYLYYTIRFQNLGTAEAINVRIEDVLDSQLDESTFQMLRSSHDYVVTRTDNNLEWVFNNINLPAEQDDAEGSVGYVYFKIKPYPGYAVGDIISNNAAIYFDFNAPIITNTFTTTFVEPLSINDQTIIDFSVYPNPAKSSVTVQFNNRNDEDYSLNIYDIHGKRLHSETISTTTNIDISSLSTGMYFLKLSNGITSNLQKLMVD